MRNFLILLFISIFNIFVGSAQEKIHSDLAVYLSKTDYSAPEDSLAAYPYKSIFRQSICFTDCSTDTVCLKLDNAILPLFNFCFYKGIHISARWGQNIKENIPFTIDDPYFIFILPDPNCEVTIEYEYQPFFLYRSSYEVVQYLLPYLYSWDSWYFTCENMQVDKVAISVPETLYFFSNLPWQNKGQSYILDTKNIKGNDISFFILTKRYYDHCSFEYKDVQVDIYQTKGTTATPDSSTYMPKESNPGLLAERAHLVKDAVAELVDLLEVDYPVKITIADKNMSAKEKVVWGTTVKSSPSEAFMLIDSLMWKRNDLYHELIHALEPDLLSSACEDSTHFFFSESLVEYLSIVLQYKDNKSKEARFDSDMMSYTGYPCEATSILGLTNNHLDGNTQGGTSLLVYQRTPFVIHAFAKWIGEDKFMEIFKDFYRQARIKNKVSFKDFEQVAKSHGITDREWNWFVNYL